MISYIIDAFNLIYRVPKLKNSDSPHIDLINYIRNNRLTGSKTNKVIIVFDGGVDAQVKQQTNYQVYFSGGGSADDVIKSKLSGMKNKSQIRVVSDDRVIRDFTKQMGAVSLRIDDFIYKNKKIDVVENTKDISYSLQREITESMRKIWNKE
ncbi:MAG: hypothetical protein GY858_03850 [Candidatus Omnitrophica bacterium]|nr:hypothetical protein [Candidatus Omnitrophota bacterium]